MKNAVGRLEGVHHVEVEMGARLVVITPAHDRTLDLAALGPAVRSGGARVVRTRIVALGTVEPGGRFRIQGWPTAYPIDGAPPPEGPRSIRASVRFPEGTPRFDLLAP